MNGPAPELVARLAAGVAGAPVSFDGWSVRDVLDAAQWHGVTGLLADRLAATGIDPVLRQALQKRRVLETALDTLRRRELVRVLRALAGRDVHPVLLKGSALAGTLYPDPALRPRFDCDLFVRQKDVETVAAVLEAMGYRRPVQVSGDLVMHQVDYVRTDPSGIRHVLDFHWKLSNRQAVANVLTFDEVEASASAATGLDGLGRVPSPQHSLVLACTHRVAHHSAHERLIWLYDIHLLAERLEPGDVDGFIALTRQRSVTLICADGLQAAQRAFATRLPARMIERLTPAASGAAEASAALLTGEPTLAREMLSDFRAVGWTERVRLLREHAFPSAQYMSAAYMVRNRAWLPALYTHRLVRGAWRLLRGAAR